MDERKLEIHQSGILIDNQRIRIGTEDIFLRAGEMHYFRVDPTEWEDRLQKLVDLGMNAVSTYIPWNWHEAQQGCFDFTSPNRDLDHFLNLCEQYNLYILVRPGPWICTEWRNGGIPDWIFDHYPETQSLTYDGTKTPRYSQKAPIMTYLHPQYLERVSQWYAHVCSIITPHQYPYGRVILFQLDNEIFYGFHGDFLSTDFNPALIPHFQEWLKLKYLRIEAVNLVYNTSYNDFDEIKWPNFEVLPNAEESPKTLLKFLDWQEFKEYIIEEFVKFLVKFARSSGIKIPLYLNMTSSNSPFNPIQLPHADPEGLLIGDDYYPNEFFDVEKGDLFFALRTELLKAWYSHLPFIPEFQGGNFDRRISAHQTHILTHLALAHGMKAFAMYMTVGGINFEGMSSNPNTIFLGGIDRSGVSYDFLAPIGENGQLNSRYSVVQHFNQFIQFHQSHLLSSNKVYDPLTWVHYFPYTRLKDIPNNLGYNMFTGTKQFGFPQNYCSWQNLSQYFFELLNRWNFQPDILELWKNDLMNLKRKKILMLYTLGWMYHDDMINLREFIAQGGILITMGDIPRLNEYFEEDFTLANIYGAICRGESSREDCIWTAETTEIPVNTVEFLYKFELDPIDNVRILAHDGEFREVYAFAREYESGKLIHTGVIPAPIDDSFPYILALLEEGEFSSKNNSASQKCIMTQISCPTGDRFIFVGNFQKNALKDVSFNFNDVQDESIEPLNIDGMIIPARTIMIWHADFAITHDIVIEYCTAEIAGFKRISSKKSELTLQFPYHPAFPNEKIVKIALILTKTSLEFKENEGNLIINEETIPHGRRILIEADESGSFIISDGDIRYLVVFEPYSLPGDEHL